MHLRAQRLGELLQALPLLQRAERQQTSAHTASDVAERRLRLLLLAKVGKRAGLDGERRAHLQLAAIFVFLVLAGLAQQFEPARPRALELIHLVERQRHLAEELVDAEVVVVETGQHQLGAVALRGDGAGKNYFSNCASFKL